MASCSLSKWYCCEWCRSQATRIFGALETQYKYFSGSLRWVWHLVATVPFLSSQEETLFWGALLSSKGSYIKVAGYCIYNILKYCGIWLNNFPKYCMGVASWPEYCGWCSESWAIVTSLLSLAVSVLLWHRCPRLYNGYNNNCFMRSCDYWRGGKRKVFAQQVAHG